MSRHACCGSNEEHYTECPLWGVGGVYDQPAVQEPVQEPVADQ